MTSQAENNESSASFYVPARAIQTGFVDVHDPVGQNLSINLCFFPKPDLSLRLSGHSKPILQSLARKKKEHKTNKDDKRCKDYYYQVGYIVQKRSNCYREKKGTSSAMKRGNEKNLSGW